MTFCPRETLRSTVRLAPAAAVAAVMSAAAFAADYALGPLTIENPHARMTIPGRPAAGYMRIRNTGGEADAIVSASSTMAERIEFHTHLMEGSVMKMRQVAKVDVPAAGETEFAPGRFHLMIFGLNENVKPGGILPLTLTFEKSGRIEVEFAVEGIGARTGAPRGGHSGHGSDQR